MADGGERVTVKVVSRLADIPAAEWDACAGDDNPFLCHAFLEALEASGSATRDSGWQPQHLALEDEGGRLLGAVPLYLKSHSYGEYVFDWGWASAYERAGGRYYPKLQCSVPFTPVTGHRLLLHPAASPAVTDGLVAAMLELARRHKVSSLHVTFPTRSAASGATRSPAASRSRRSPAAPSSRAIGTRSIASTTRPRTANGATRI